MASSEHAVPLNLKKVALLSWCMLTVKERLHVALPPNRLRVGKTLGGEA